MPTLFANSTFVIRPSAWISLRILRSISSRFLDTGIPASGTALAAVLSVTLLDQLGRLAQFYCAILRPIYRDSGENSLIWIAILAWLARCLRLGFDIFSARRRLPGGISPGAGRTPVRDACPCLL